MNTKTNTTNTNETLTAWRRIFAALCVFVRVLGLRPINGRNVDRIISDAERELVEAIVDLLSVRRKQGDDSVHIEVTHRKDGEQREGFTLDAPREGLWLLTNPEALVHPSRMSHWQVADMVEDSGDGHLGRPHSPVDTWEYIGFNSGTIHLAWVGMSHSGNTAVLVTEEDVKAFVEASDHEAAMMCKAIPSVLKTQQPQRLM